MAVWWSGRLAVSVVEHLTVEHFGQTLMLKRMSQSEIASDIQKGCRCGQEDRHGAVWYGDGRRGGE